MPVHDLPESPLKKANFLSAISFWWLKEVFKKGYARPLEFKDTYKILPQDESSFLGDEFEKQRKSGTTKTTLFSVLWNIFGCRFLLIGLIGFFDDCILKIAKAFCLGYLIGYFAGTVDENEGYLACGGIILVSILEIFTMHSYFFEMERIGMQIRLGCATALYRKVLRISLTSLSGGAAGQMMNLVANDVNRLDNLTRIHHIWIGVVQAGISTCILWKSLGPACLCGLAVLILFIPVQGLLGGVLTALRTKVAPITDSRIRIMNEILEGIRAIKMQCWEYTFANLVEVVRKDEVSVIRKISFLRSINWSLYYTSSKVAIFLTLIVYVLNGNHLTAETVFVAVTLYNNIRITMSRNLPSGIAQLVDSFVTFKRIEKFLLLEERTPPKVRDVQCPHISLRNVSTSWNNGDKHVILGVSLEASSSQLVAIVGPVGSGKTTFLHLLLGELYPRAGVAEIQGKVSYFSQIPWIFSGTVRENILFGQEYREGWYNQVIECCALRRDFMLFGTAGDATVIGDRGVNLSGGLKARISLARAVYAQADIYLLDDPLSAVDAEVSRHIFEQCLKTLLRQKLVLLVTHQLQFLRSVDKIVVVERGKCVADGTFSQLQNSGIQFENLISIPDDPDDNGNSTKRRKSSATNRTMDSAGDAGEVDATNVPFSFEKRPSGAGKFCAVDEATSSAGIPEETLDEEMSVGNVKFSAYKRYFGAGSNSCSILMLIIFNVLTQTLHTGSDYWLKVWASDTERPRNVTQDGSHDSYYHYETDKALQKTSFIPEFDLSDIHNQILLYSSIISFLFIFSMIRTVTFFQLCIAASVKIHKQMISAVLRAPLRFFYLNPTGRILNRFTKDTDVMDDQLPETFFDTMEVFFNVCGIIVIVSIVSPYVLIPTFFLAFAFYFIRQMFTRSTRSMQRLEALARSPVYSHVTSTLSGLVTIRAFKVESDFNGKFCETQDMHTATWFLNIAMRRWIGLWLDAIAVMFIASLVTILMLTGSTISGAAAGMAISSAMFLTGTLQWGVRQSTVVESQMVSIERILEYTQLEPEASLRSERGKEPPDSWPFEGKLSIKNMYLQYGNQPPTLKNIDLQISPKDKIGIVGRTGAGKSSLVTALFRLAEPTGQLEMDGVNIRSIGLHELRSRMSIIPQDPFLFRATLRQNLNTGRNYTDDELWESIKVVGLEDVVRASPEGLDLEIQEGGSNFSVGERQLLCLARAILQRNKILILDEATASVDLETDQLLQRTIREKFQDCTVLTIAHRLFTVMDCDKIIVMDEGLIKEFDSPHLLLQNRVGFLNSLVDQTGEESSRKLRSVAMEAHQKKNSSGC